MAFLEFNAEDLPVDGSELTTSNQGASGDAASLFKLGTTASLTGTATAGEVIFGKKSARLVTASTDRANLYWPITVSALGARVYIRFATAPTGSFSIFGLYTTAFAAKVVFASTTNKLVVQDSAGTVVYTTPNAITFPGIYGLDLSLQKGTGSSDGKIKFAIYDVTGAFAGGMTAAFETLTANTTTANSTQVAVGKLDSTASDMTMFIDDMRIVDAYGLVGPRVATTYKSFNSEGVPTDGTEITSGNQGASGDVLTIVKDAGASTTGTASASEIIDGARSLKLTAPSGAGNFVYWSEGGLSAAGMRTYITLSSTTVNYAILSFRNSTTNAAKLLLLTNGKLFIQDAVGTSYTSPSALSLPGTYCIDMAIQPGTSTTDGRIKFAVYDVSGAFAGGMTAVYEGLSYNTGTTALTSLRVGKVEQPAIVTTQIIDDLKRADQYELLGPTTITPIRGVQPIGSASAYGLGSVVLTPDGTIVNGDWIIVVISSVLSYNLETPFGWEDISPQHDVGTLRGGVYRHKRLSGETSYTFTAYSTYLTGAIFWVRGADTTWSIGTIGDRDSNGTTTTNVAPVVITTQANETIYSISLERTLASETDVTSVTNATEYLFVQQSGSSTATIAIATQSLPVAGATSDVTFTYPNAVATNGYALQIAIPSASSPAFGRVLRAELAIATPTAVFSWVSGIGFDYIRIGVSAIGTDQVRIAWAFQATPTSKNYTSYTGLSAFGWATLRVTDLVFNTSYIVTVESGSTVLSSHTVTTLSSTIATFKVAVASSQFTGSNHVVFDRIVTDAPQLFLHQGNIHYGNDSNETDWRTHFSASMSASKLQTLLSTIPMNYVWNEHDFGGSGSYNGSPAASYLPTAIRELTGEYLDSTALYRTWTHHGLVRFIQLDTITVRSAYTATESSGKVLLGAAQEAWLYATLTNAKEPIIVMLSVFPFTTSTTTPARFGSYTTETGRVSAWLTARPGIQSRIVTIGGDSQTISADDGANTLANIPSLNVSPLNQSGGSSPGGTWDLTDQAIDASHGYFSRLTFTWAAGNGITMQWDAVRDDNTVMATWTRLFGFIRVWDGTKEIPATSTVWNGTSEIQAVETYAYNPVFVQKQTYFSTADATTHTITFVQATTSGNTLVAMIASSAVITTPAGWTKIVDNLNALHIAGYRKTTSGGETSAAFTVSALRGLTAAIYEFNDMGTTGVSTGTTYRAGPTDVVIASLSSSTPARIFAMTAFAPHDSAAGVQWDAPLTEHERLEVLVGTDTHTQSSAFGDVPILNDNIAARAAPGSSSSIQGIGFIIAKL